MTDLRNNSDAYNSPWKDVLEHAFPEFMAFYSPASHARIDWAHGHAFKTPGCVRWCATPSSTSALPTPWSKSPIQDGKPHWIYIHIEVQGQRDSDFARRMFTYNYQLFDRYARPITSLAMLADADAE